MDKINMNRRFVLLTFVLILLLSATIQTSFLTTASFEQTTNSDSITPFPQTGKFYTLAARTVVWETVNGKNITSHDEEITKWSIHNITDNIVSVNRTYVDLYINPETHEHYTETEDFDYQIAMNRTILSAYWKGMAFTLFGFSSSGERSLDEDVGEHTWAWFPTNLYIGAYVLVSWTADRSYLGDMLYEVVDDEAIKILGERQDCWMLRMPPSITVDGKRVRTETYWVDKDTGIPLKISAEEWALDGFSGWTSEYVLVNTNIDLGPESAQSPSPTYTLTVPTTPGWPAAGKFYTLYFLEEGWYMSGATNITYYFEGLIMWWVANVTGTEALVHKIFWYEYVSEAGDSKELESVGIQCYNYTMDINTREILRAAGLFYGVNMTSLIYQIEDRTPLLAGDVGEETYCWLPTNLNIGANVNITCTHDRPTNVDNATYTVIGEGIINTLGKPQACWILHMPSTSSIDGTWNYTEIIYSDKDVGITLGGGMVGKGWAVDGGSVYEYAVQFIDTSVDLGPNTYVFPVVVDSQSFDITVVTNSTIPVQTFNFSKENKKLSFNVTGLSGTSGSCNITIPRTMLDCASLDEWLIFANGIDISDTCVKSRDVDYTYICIPYTHSTQLIQVRGTWVVPEFPLLIIMLLFIIWTLLAVIFYRRKHHTCQYIT